MTTTYAALTDHELVDMLVNMASAPDFGHDEVLDEAIEDAKKAIGLRMGSLSDRLARTRETVLDAARILEKNGKPITAGDLRLWLTQF